MPWGMMISDASPQWFYANRENYNASHAGQKIWNVVTVRSSDNKVTSSTVYTYEYLKGFRLLKYAVRLDVLT